MFIHERDKFNKIFKIFFRRFVANSLEKLRLLAKERRILYEFVSVQISKFIRFFARKNFEKRSRLHWCGNISLIIYPFLFFLSLFLHWFLWIVRSIDRLFAFWNLVLNECSITHRFIAVKNFFCNFGADSITQIWLLFASLFFYWLTSVQQWDIWSWGLRDANSNELIEWMDEKNELVLANRISSKGLK